MSRAALGLLLLTASLGGCGALDPYPTVPRATQPGQPAGARVAICYNTMKSTLAQLQGEAQQDRDHGVPVQATRAASHARA